MHRRVRVRDIRPFLRSRDGAQAYIQSPDRIVVRAFSTVDVSKMVYSTYKKQRILYLYSKGYRPPTIKKMLDKENLKCSRVGVYKFLKLYNATRSISRRVGSGRPSKITAEIKQLVEQQMRIDDETTAYQLHRMLTEKGYSILLHNTEVSNCARMDVSRQRVLSANSRTQQAEATPMGTAAHWPVI